MRTEKPIKLKTGETLPKGLPVSFEQGKWTACTVHGERDYRVRVTAAFVPPSIEELEEAVSDGVCMSVAGYPTEPDGWDEKGSPSWLLALGMI